jgi:1-acyl-sn-glycerol-3-phosphate acyltransferase
MLPLALVGKPFRKHVRYVMKHELQWNPCVDVVGHRIPTAFVKRGKSQHRDAEIAKVMALGDHLGPEGIALIYPEGTRFTPHKRATRLAEISAQNPSLLEKARSLRHVLPPHLGGSLALLARAEGASVVFCAHVGLDGVVTFGDFTGGVLLDRHVRVAFFRVPSEEVPEGESARIEWLYDQWMRVDEWIERTLEGEGRGAR